MLQNAYFLAKIGFDTAENEPAKILQRFAAFFSIFQHFANFANARRSSPSASSFSRTFEVQLGSFNSLTARRVALGPSEKKKRVRDLEKIGHGYFLSRKRTIPWCPIAASASYATRQEEDVLSCATRSEGSSPFWGFTTRNVLVAKNLHVLSCSLCSELPDISIIFYFHIFQTFYVMQHLTNSKICVLSRQPRGVLQ